MKNANVQQILANFDFEKVRKVMELLNWKWVDSEKTPTIGELYQTAEQLLNMVSNSLFTTSDQSTEELGGFVATIYDNGDLRLSFVVENYEVVHED